MRIRTFFYILLISSVSLYAQQNDANLWMGIGIQKKINDKLSTGVEQQFRFSENYSYLNTALTEIGLTYKLSNAFRIAGNYRFSNKFNEKIGHYIKNRVNIDASIKHKIERFSVNFRTRFQSTSGFEGVELYNRNKFVASYEINTYFKPAIYLELFTPLNAGENTTIFDQYRIGVTNNIEISKKINIGSGFIFQKPLNSIIPTNDYILSLSFEYKI